MLQVSKLRRFSGSAVIISWAPYAYAALGVVLRGMWLSLAVAGTRSNSPELAGTSDVVWDCVLVTRSVSDLENSVSVLEL